MKFKEKSQIIGPPHRPPPLLIKLSGSMHDVSHHEKKKTSLGFLYGEWRAGCFALFVFLVSLDCCVPLPHGATGLSAVCDCGIS